MLHSQSPWDLSIYDKATPRKFANTSTQARASAVQFENQIRREAIEHGAFYAADGSEILARVGLQANIGFSTAELQMVKGALFTHNHPGGFSFSLADVLNACEWQLIELRVVCEEWRHIMNFRNGWPSRPAVQSEYTRIEPLVLAEVASDVRSGHLDPRYACWEIQHRRIHQLASHFHLPYEREPS